MGGTYSKSLAQRIELASVTLAGHAEPDRERSRASIQNVAPQRRSRLNPESTAGDEYDTIKEQRMPCLEKEAPVSREAHSFVSKGGETGRSVAMRSWDEKVLGILGLGLPENGGEPALKPSSLPTADRQNGEDKIYIESIASWGNVNLCSRNIHDISPNIGIVADLITSLQICCNKLRAIPEEIGLLSNLLNLSVARNQLSMVPASIGFLARLTDLNLSNNNLSTLPRSLVALSQLQILDLQDNNLSWIQPEIFISCRKLTIINLNGNPIQILPSELLQCRMFRRIRLERCPLIDGIPGQHFATAAPNIICDDWLHAFAMHRLIPSSLFQEGIPVPVSQGTGRPLNPLAPTASGHPPFPIPLRYLSSPLPAKYKGQKPFGVVIGTGSARNVGSDDPLFFPIPSLRESCARWIMRHNSNVPVSIPTRLADYLTSARTCSFCGGPYFESWTPRCRMMVKGDTKIPLLYRLCSIHWRRDSHRIEEMFTSNHATSPRALGGDDRLAQDLESKMVLHYQLGGISATVSGKQARMIETFVIDMLSQLCSGKRDRSIGKKEQRMINEIKDRAKSCIQRYSTGDVPHPYAPFMVMNPYAGLDTLRLKENSLEAQKDTQEMEPLRSMFFRCVSKMDVNDEASILYQARVPLAALAPRVAVPLAPRVLRP